MSESREVVRVTLPGPPTPSDPLASNYRDGSLALDPTDVLGTVVETRPDGSAVVVVGERGRGGGQIRVIEGVGVDTYGRLGELLHAELRALRDALATMIEDPDPRVKLAARTARAMLDPGPRKRVAFDVLNVATTLTAPAELRAFALLMAACIAVAERAELRDGNET